MQLLYFDKNIEYCTIIAIHMVEKVVNYITQNLVVIKRQHFLSSTRSNHGCVSLAQHFFFSRSTKWCVVWSIFNVVTILVFKKIKGSLQKVNGNRICITK